MLLGVALAVVIASQVVSALTQPTAVPRPRSQTATVDAGSVQSVDGPSTETAGELATIDHSIKAWTANLAANDTDFLSATNLGQLYDGRARLTGDVGDYQRAIEALNRALSIEPSHLPARLLHARELQATHDFAGALAEATAINRETPGLSQALATMGDASLELGDIDAAGSAFEQLQSLAPGAAVTARLSRIAFLRGDTAGALALATRAVDEAAAVEESGPSASWYSYLCGILAMSGGDPARALAWFDAALSAWPQSYLALAGRARALAGLDRIEDAIVAYQAAVAIAPQPETLAALGDLYALQGDEHAANEQYATVELIAQLATINAQVYNRQLALFWLNHDRQPAEALKLTETELAQRKDVYGYDAYAWALLANGRTADADAAAEQALVLGTQDATFFYHAGVIAHAVGDDARARSLLERALALPGALDPLSSSKASATLALLP